jgi:hypothetical protein
MELVLIIGFAVIFGAWSANAAERKGYDRSVGWILGIFLGVIGRVIVGVFRDKTLDAPVLGLNGTTPPRSDVLALPSGSDQGR